MVRRRPLALLGALLALALAPAPAGAYTLFGAGGAFSALSANPPENTTPLPPAGWLQGDYSVELSATDPDGDLDRLQWRVNGGAEQDAANLEVITVSGDGVHTLETRALDLGGNDSGWRADTVRIDGSLPTDLTDAGTTAWRPAPATVTVNGTDAVSGLDRMEWRIDGGALESGPSGSEVTIAGDGEHILSTRAVDVAGNESAWRDHTVRIDTVAPTDTTAAPAGWQTAPVPVTVTGTDEHSGVTEVRWRIDGGGESTGPPGTIVNVTGDGEHTLDTRVRDAAGHLSGWKTHTIRIDTTAPENQTALADTAWRAADYAVLVKGADGGSGLAHVEWRNNGGAVTSGPSGIQADVTGTGVHSFETRAVDSAGNASAWRGETIRIDKVKPTNTTPAAPTAPVPNPYTVTLSGTDDHAGVAYLEWTVDGGAEQTAGSGDEIEVTGHGTHTLSTRVVDGAGNRSDWRTETVEIDVALNDDTTPPTDTTTTLPVGWETGPVAITISATDAEAGVRRVQWRLAGRPIETHEGDSTTITVADEGAQTLETRAVDWMGNRSEWRLQTIRIDLTVPTDTTAIGPGWQNARTFTLAATDAHSGVEEIEYRIDGGPQQRVPAGTEVQLDADGAYEVEHRAIDHAGHASALKVDTLRVDTVAPDNTSGVPSSAWSASALELPLTGADALSGLAGMQWRLDGGAVQDGGPASVAADGEHVLETRAVDLAGNASPWRADTVRVDVTAPDNLTPAAPGGWRAGPYVVEVAAGDGDGSGVAALQHTLNGGPVSEDPEVSVSGDGVHALRTRVVDAVGHASAWRTETIRIDSVKPQLGLACGGAGWNPRPVTCTLSADGGPSGLASLTLARNGGPALAAARGSVAVHGDGVHRLAAAATDGAGNRAAAQAVVRIDRSAPVVALACEDGSCRITASDATSGVATTAYSIDGGAWRSSGATFAATTGAVRARAVDRAGNATVTAPVVLEPAPEGPRGRARSASLPVYLRGREETGAMIGALRAARSESGAVRADLRPLALGKGRYKLKLRVKAGKRKRTVRRTVRLRRGDASPRLRTRLKGAARRATVTLKVHRRKRGRWRRHATARLALPR